MRALLHSGLVIVFGLVVARSIAEEVQWRSANSPAASPSVDNPRGLLLGRPVPLEGEPDVAPVTFRPATSVVRPTADNARPLPNGPTLSPETIRVIEDPVTTDFQKESKDETKKELDKKWTAPRPRPVDGVPAGEPYLCDPSPLCCPTWCCRERVVCRERCWEECGCDMGGGCLERGGFWLSAEYLVFNVADQAIPPLVTTSPPGTPITEAGVLGAPGTTVLFDERAMFNQELNGGRFTLGFWFPRYSDLALETSFFFFGRRSYWFQASSAGDPILARPIFDVVTGTEVSQLVAFPGMVSGTVRVDYNTRMWGLDFGFRHKLCCDCRSWIDLTCGYRHFYLEDNVDIREDLLAAQAVGDPLGIFVHDSFRTHNLFNGLYLGIEAERKLLRRWFISGYAKLAFGVNHQVININGETTFSTIAPGLANPQPAGILALPTNIGRHTNDRFAVMPEFGFKFGYTINESFRVWVGWNGLWLTDAVRAGEQIDRGINRSQIPNNITGIGPLVGPARPRVLFNEQTFWANGLTLGLEYRY